MGAGFSFGALLHRNNNNNNDNDDHKHEEEKKKEKSLEEEADGIQMVFDNIYMGILHVIFIFD